MDGKGPEAEAPPPWEIQDSEPALYFDVFRRYLLGGNEDVKAAVAEWYESRGETPPRKVEDRFYKAAAKWSWKARSRKYWALSRLVEDREIQRRRTRARARRLEILDVEIERTLRVVRRLATEDEALFLLWVKANPKEAASRLKDLFALEREDLFDTADDRKARDEARPLGGPDLPDLDERLVTPNK